jgi:DNA-binding response OmpR family regulator
MDRTLLVVIAEDDVPVREVLAKHLRRAGISVVETGDGEQTLAALSESLPDLLCLDLNLPVLSGFDVFRRVREQPALRDLAVLVITGRDTLDDMASARELGAIGFVVKPFRPRDLADRVLRLLRQP